MAGQVEGVEKSVVAFEFEIWHVLMLAMEGAHQKGESVAVRMP